MNTFPRNPVGPGLAVLLACLWLAGCGRPADKPTPPVPEVTVKTIQPQSVVISSELPGRTAPYRIAEVRARVDGIVLKRDFTEGSDVKAGQRLFQIDPAPYQATFNRANASLAKARADLAAKTLQARRIDSLKQQHLVSQQANDDTQASYQQAQADVDVATADVESARINLGYTEVVAPIDGNIGKSLVTEGAYVRQTEATPLAIVQQLDPLYVDVIRSSAELLQLRQDIQQGVVTQTDSRATAVTIKLEDGSTYAHTGTFQFADSTVDPGTGTVTLRAVIPNPEHQLLPGMFVHARIESGVSEGALLVPQQAVTYDAKGQATTLVVGPTNTVEVRVLQLGRSLGNQWLVTSGLTAGDRVIMEGLQKITPGAAVSAVEMNTAIRAP
jgi:membrane fusion protein (multidrug efflux system)